MLSSSPLTDPQYKKLKIEDEVLYTWIIDSMSTELENHFVKYETMKDIWDACHKYHSKKNDRSKTAHLVNREGALKLAKN